MDYMQSIFILLISLTLIVILGITIIFIMFRASFFKDENEDDFIFYEKEFSELAQKSRE